MKKLTSNINIQKKLGQGMTEYIIIVALVAVAAIGAFKMFGQTAQQQIAGLATELAGQDAEAQITEAQGKAESAIEQANINRGLGNYNGGNAAE